MACRRKPQALYGNRSLSLTPAWLCATVDHLRGSYESVTSEVGSGCGAPTTQETQKPANRTSAAL